MRGCGRHTCQAKCHAGSCEVVAEFPQWRFHPSLFPAKHPRSEDASEDKSASAVPSCGQSCGLKLRSCDHTCTRRCHPIDDPCETPASADEASSVPASSAGVAVARPVCSVATVLPCACGVRSVTLPCAVARERMARDGNVLLLRLRVTIAFGDRISFDRLIHLLL